MNLRPMAAQDVPAAMHLCRAAGWNQLEDDWRVFFDSPGSGGFLIEKDSSVVGTVAFIRYDALAWIAMMLVDPQQRRAGIGARLMEEALSALSSAPCVGLDATPMGQPLYRRFGFVQEYAMVRTKATIDAARFGQPTGRARPMRLEDLSAVLPRDREVFGADRSQLLAGLFSRSPECPWIVKDPEVRGYCFGRPRRLYRPLRPVVAGSHDTARELLAHSFSQLDGHLFAIDAPMLDSQWTARLQSLGS